MLEKERIFELIGLNKEIGEVRGRVLGSDPLSSIYEVFATVRREESQRIVMMGTTHNSITPLDNSALKIEAALASNQRNFKKNDDKCKRPKCDHCNKPWHTKVTCLKIHGKPAHLKNGKTPDRNYPALYIVEERK
ncbi:hypothetical protein PanWU01x14_243310 [Parasponia andersonii]|uniref:Uncharacterized protein n=1 Tax=Parasponia andersonii TaxID=3476 RepID=A0A2P5BFK7_PARAD|nr:hypothetical protein PanWU01x14_243310 [Parasponia andersonii]